MGSGSVLWLNALLSSLYMTQLATAICYNVDGRTIAINDTACDSSAATSACCYFNDFCLDNGLCLHDAVYQRSSCTDPAWGPPCRPVCRNLNPTGGGQLVNCGLAFGIGPWTCFNDSCDNRFNIPGGSQIVLRPEQLVNLGISTALTLGPSATIPPPPPLSSSSTGNTTTPFPFSTTAVGSSTSSSTSSAGSQSGSNHEGTIAATTIGAVLGVALLLAGFYLFWRQRKKNKKTEQVASKLRNRGTENSVASNTAPVMEEPSEQRQIAEVSDQARMELEAERQPTELMEQRRSRSELQA